MESEKPHYNVVILTPGHSVTAHYLKSLLVTVNFLGQNGISWNFMNQYSSHVGDSRERTIGGENYNTVKMSAPGGGTFTYDKLFWIDSDISWTVEQFMRLYNSPKHIISGVYLLDDGTVPVYKRPMVRGLTKAEIGKMKEPFRARACGFGFICIAQGVFERIERPWFGSVEVEVTNDETNEVSYIHPLMGEDTAWCEKAYRLGMQLWIDPLVRVEHQKTVRLGW